ncbi:MAG: sodium/solute symporter [Fidelibacterota bacterium]|nr:MAG: sodium/solute symporter [Candidatus Neomarinimicrobiota bacterium]
MPKLWLIDYLVMGCHLLLMVGVGFFFYRYVKSANDFFKSSNRLPWWVAGLSSFMSGFSAWTFTGGAGKIYESGISGAAILWASSVAVMLSYFIFAKRWRRSRITTVMEFMSERYNRFTHQFYSWVYVIMKWFIVGLQLLSTAIFISVAIGVDVRIVVVVAGMTMLTYSVLSGLWGVSTNDTLQFIVVASVTMVAAPLSLHAVGGIGDFIARVPEGFFRLGNDEVSLFFIFGWMLLMFYGNNSNATVQRYFSVKDERAARRVALTGAVLFFVGVSLWMIPSMVARIMYPDLSGMAIGLQNPSEAAYVVMCIQVLPHGLIGVLLAAIFAATMSSLDSSYNVMAGVLVKDVYHRWIHPKASAKHLLLVSRLCILLIGASATGLALVLTSHSGGVFGVMKDISQVITVPVATALLLGLIVRKTPPWTAVFSFVLTFIVAYTTRYVYDLHLGYQALAVVGTSISSFTVMRLFWNRAPQVDRERIEGFFRKLDTPIDVDRELSEPVAADAVSMLQVVGVLLFAVGLIIVVPTVFLDQWSSILIALSEGLFLMGLGSFMFLKGRQKIRNLTQSMSEA